MFNVLSGLHEGSQSVVTVSREVNTGQGPFVNGQLVKTVAGKYTVATLPAEATQAEFVFEGTSYQSSQKVTGLFGHMEAETDVYNGTPAVDDLLTVGTGGKLTVTVTAAEAKWKVTGKNGTIIIFRSLN